MKNKRLITVVVIILVYLAGAFIYGKASGEKKVLRRTRQNNSCWVLQYVSHPALDEIYRGIKDGLKEEGLKEGENLEIKFQNGQADQSKLANESTASTI